MHGQARAKQDLAVAVYNHYLGQAHRARGGADLGRQHILLLGPTGVGKTYLVRTLVEHLGVPLGFASAAGFVEAGYKGNSVDTLVQTLLDRAGEDPKLAEKGIVFLDEVDKIRRGDTGGTRDAGRQWGGGAERSPDAARRPAVRGQRELAARGRRYVEVALRLRRRVRRARRDRPAASG